MYLSRDKWFKEALKGYFTHFFIFMAIFIPFMVGSHINFKPGILIIFFVLLLFVKRMKSIYYLFLISLPFTNPVWSYNSWFNMKITYMFFILLFISFLYLKLKDQDYSFVVTSLDIPLFLFLLVATISVFQSGYIGSNPIILFDSFRNFPWVKGIISVIFLLAMYLVYHVISNLIKDKMAFKETLFVMIINAVVVSLYGLVGYLNMIITSRQLPSIIDPMMHYLNTGLRIKAVAGEPFFLGSFLLSVLPIVCCLLVLNKEYFSRRFLLFSCIILTLTILLTLSRGVWLGLFVFFVMFIYWTRQRYWVSIYKPLLNISIKSLSLVLLLLIVLVGIDYIANIGIKEGITNAAYDLTEPVMSIFNPEYGRFWSTKVRLWAFEYAWEGFKMHPILGIGYSNYGFYSGNRVYPGLYFFAINLPEVNNLPLRILSETGLVGFIIALYLFIFISWKLLKSIKSRESETEKCLIMGYSFTFIALGTLFLFSSYINHLYLWVFMAMMMHLIGARKIMLNGDENDT